MDERPAPDWLGDVTLGVEAWAGKVEPAPSVEPSSRRRSDDVSRPARSRRRKSRGADPAPKKAPKGDSKSDPEPDQEAIARKILLDTLTGQARSRKELADKLAKKEIPDDLATRLLDRFEEVGLVDDEAFAKAWIASRQPGKGLARRALAQELRRKGIDDEVAREALDEIDPDDEREAARVLVRRKLRSLERFDDQTKTRRLVGMLARKGYGAGVAFGIVRDELALADEDDAGGLMSESDL
ncbi:regulatory protein [Nocardioides albertanoniae]|uniref:Regulatory protein RecX n=1 Tax=Nocardioides albertanoniae TaxID=1175486 RepID=A0A543A681_9ACTN|nr:regulatory protein RecX [Nocardioides albertanoniae]TQL68094.1 regulatory protein [Nocardioides albertanoniae]